jgi:hypothetical protein
MISKIKSKRRLYEPLNIKVYFIKLICFATEKNLIFELNIITRVEKKFIKY